VRPAGRSWLAHARSRGGLLEGERARRAAFAGVRATLVRPCSGQNDETEEAEAMKNLQSRKFLARARTPVGAENSIAVGGVRFAVDR
jgi:hypothetical protein